MKEFMLKHPFWAYCMLNCICVTIENIVNRGQSREKYLNQVFEMTGEELEKLKRKFDKKDEKIVPMGFHFNREEA